MADGRHLDSYLDVNSWVFRRIIMNLFFVHKPGINQEYSYLSKAMYYPGVYLYVSTLHVMAAHWCNDAFIVIQGLRTAS